MTSSAADSPSKNSAAGRRQILINYKSKNSATAIHEWPDSESNSRGGLKILDPVPSSSSVVVGLFHGGNNKEDACSIGSGGRLRSPKSLGKRQNATMVENDPRTPPSSMTPHRGTTTSREPERTDGRPMSKGGAAVNPKPVSLRFNAARNLKGDAAPTSSSDYGFGGDDVDVVATRRQPFRDAVNSSVTYAAENDGARNADVKPVFSRFSATVDEQSSADRNVAAAAGGRTPQGKSGDRSPNHLPTLAASPSLPTSPCVGRRWASALSRPTRHVYKVDSISCDDYVQLNQYKLTREIGQGSYGIVKLAYNEEDNNHYAMKILDRKKLMKKFAFFKKPPCRKNRPSSVPDPLGQVQREIAILKKLSHRNVVKLVEVLEDSNDNYLYMVFEYVERGCVLDIPTSEPLPESLAWSYFRDTLMGLEYLHFHKIVHRDIKPSNLLLTESGRVKIADFGVSSEFEGIDAILSGTAGTPAFMAPEALIEDASHFYSGRAQDIWSLGITLFSFVYGQVPFWDAYVIALHRKIKNDPIVFPAQPVIHVELVNLIEHLLNKNPADRLTLPGVKVHPWVTKHGKEPLPSEEENCQLVTVTEDDIRNSVKTVPRLDTLILIKAMGHRRHFCNPFKKLAETQHSQQELAKHGFLVNRCVSMTHDTIRNNSRTGDDLYAACANIRLENNQISEDGFGE